MYVCMYVYMHIYIYIYIYIYVTRRHFGSSHCPQASLGQYDDT